jgi:heme-degrading monooxygenase HmoA
MYARIVTTEIVPETAEEFSSTWAEVVAGEPPPGWIQAFLTHDPKTNQIVGISLWESEAHANAYEASGRFREDAMKLARFRAGDATKPPPVITYKVLSHVTR